MDNDVQITRKSSEFSWRELQGMSESLLVKTLRHLGMVVELREGQCVACKGCTFGWDQSSSGKTFKWTGSQKLSNVLLAVILQRVDSPYLDYSMTHDFQTVVNNEDFRSKIEDAIHAVEGYFNQPISTSSAHVVAVDLSQLEFQKKINDTLNHEEELLWMNQSIDEQIKEKLKHLGQQHFDMGGRHAAHGTLNCNCSTAKEWREMKLLQEKNQLNNKKPKSLFQIKDEAKQKEAKEGKRFINLNDDLF